MKGSTSASAKSRSDQRRSRRWRALLPVEIYWRGQVFQLRATDVGRHGMHVAMDDPPPERLVVRLTVQLPSGPLGATACVSHRRSVPGQPSGMGLHFFALSAEAKKQWEQYMEELAGHSSRPALPSLASPDTSAFFVKPRDIPRLREFFANNVLTGSMKLDTPVLRDPGTRVVLVVVHPDTGNECVLHARVAQVHRERPKWMTVRFHGLGPAQKEAFERFVVFGEGYVAPATVPPDPPDPPRQATDFDVSEDDVLEDGPFFGWDPAAEPRALGLVDGALIPLVMGEPLEVLQPAPISGLSHPTMHAVTNDPLIPDEATPSPLTGTVPERPTKARVSSSSNPRVARKKTLPAFGPKHSLVSAATSKPPPSVEEIPSAELVPIYVSTEISSPELSTSFPGARAVDSDVPTNPVLAAVPVGSDGMAAMALAVEGWRKLVTVLEAHLEDIRKQRDDLRTQRDAAKTEIAALKSELAQVKERCSQLEARLASSTTPRPVWEPQR